MRVLIFILLASASLAASADALLEQARAHINDGNPELAWKLLAPQNAERAGEVEYDYLLGIAALDTGRRTEAVFALERVLAVDPDHAEARAEIARAYFELNELERAKAQFNQVLQDDTVPAAARAEIARFLDAIEAIETDKQTAWNFYVALAVGNDDNVNTGPSSETVAVPLFGGAIVTLDESALPEESIFTTTRFRANLTHRLRPNTQLLAGLGLALRRNSESDAERFDNDSVNFNVGVRWLRSEFSHFTLSLQGQDFELDGDAYRDVYGVLAQWRHRLQSNREVSVYGKLSEIEYDEQPARDADRQLVGGGLSQFFPGKRNPLLYVGLYIGEEETQDDSAPYLGYDFVGLRFGGQIKVGDRSIAFASFSWENREYAEDDPFFLDSRDDDNLSAGLGMRFKPRRQWTISPELRYSENDSNFELNDNDKTSISVTTRYDF